MALNKILIRNLIEQLKKFEDSDNHYLIITGDRNLIVIQEYCEEVCEIKGEHN